MSEPRRGAAGIARPRPTRRRTTTGTVTSRSAAGVAGRPGGSRLRRPGNPVRRQRVLLAVVLAVVAVFVVRLAYVQVYRGPALAAVAQEQRMATKVTIAHRGDITDADGVVLATSVDRFTIAADQVAIADFQPRRKDTVDGRPLTEGGAVGLAKLLSPVLGIPAPVLAAQLNGTNRYAILKKNVVPEVQRAVAELNVGAWISTTPTSERTYPAGAVGGNLVGFVSTTPDGAVGRGGVEAVYDKTLAGTPGEDKYERGRGGQRIPTGAREQVDAVPGDDVRLTVIRDVQWKSQDAIDEAVRTTGASYGIVVVQDIKTGAVAALADSGTVDPNDRSTDAVAAPSRAVSNIFDPGSTGKVITMAAALEGGYAKADTRFTVPYRYTAPNGMTFSDSHEHGVQRLTLAGVLAESSNTGTVQVGERIPKQVRYDYLSKFGFGEPTGLGLPGESAGILHSADSWDGRTQYAVLFGQGVSVNAVQATSVFSTIANGGVRMQPHLVAGTSTADGKFTAAEMPEGTPIVSAGTAKTVLRMMEAVVDKGTGSHAAVPGYRVAGKTGTAQVVGGDGKLSGIMSSFIGVAPADHPRYTVSVFLRDPKTSSFGGDVAAPVFADIMGFTLEHMGVTPSEEPYVALPTTW